MMRFIIALFAIALIGMPLRGDEPGNLERVLNGGFSYRNLGPFRAGSWVADIAVPESPAKAHLYTFYVAARNRCVELSTRGPFRKSECCEPARDSAWPLRH